MPKKPVNQVIPLPTIVLDQLAGIPLDELIELIIGMKTGVVHVAVEIPENATEEDREAADEVAHHALALQLLEDELARRRQ